MKNKLIVGSLLVILLAVAVKVYATTMNVDATNASNEVIGTVYLNLANSTQTSMYVGGNGLYQTQTAYAVVSITVNGQTIAVNSQGIITLPNSHEVFAGVAASTDFTHIGVQFTSPPPQP